MKVRVLGACGSEGLGQRPSAFLVDDHMLVDAGTVTGALTVPQQLQIEHALVSHSHLDHVGGIAYLAETLACCESQRPVTVMSSEPVIESLRSAIFNDVLWPDFSRIPCAETSVIKYRSLAEDAEQRVGHLWVTPIRVDHTVPAVGYAIHNGNTGFIYSGDTGPTETLWKAARNLNGIRAVILECAFPNRLTWLANLAKHLTPDLIRRELDKLPLDIPVWIFHIKPQFRAETLEDLSKLAGRRVVVLEQDQTYSL